ncbi:MAG TPA: hypothetical protein VGN34_30845, partial [Ktedonobacteraceae bacterium]
MSYQHFVLSLTSSGGNIMHMLNTTQQYSASSLPFSLPNELSLLIVSSICALLLSFLLTLVVIKVAHTFGWLDRSTTERKRIHKKPVPRLGGTAIFLAFVVVS